MNRIPINLKQKLFILLNQFKSEYEEIRTPFYNELDIKMDGVLSYERLVHEYYLLYNTEYAYLDESKRKYWLEHYQDFSNIKTSERVRRLAEIDNIFDDLLMQAETDSNIRLKLDNLFDISLITGVMPRAISHYGFKKNGGALPKPKINKNNNLRSNELYSMLMFALKESGFSIIKNRIEKVPEKDWMTGSEMILEWILSYEDKSGKIPSQRLTSHTAVERVWGNCAFKIDPESNDLYQLAVSWADRIKTHTDLSS